jgi:hypothetical protein
MVFVEVIFLKPDKIRLFCNQVSRLDILVPIR